MGSYFEQVIKVNSNPGRVIATAAQPYDTAPFMTQLGGAFAAAGIAMSDNAKAVLRERVNAEYGSNFQEREELEKALAAKEKEEAAAAVAAAEAADANEAAATEEEPVAA